MQADVDRRETQAQVLRDQLAIQRANNNAEDITPTEPFPAPPVVLMDGSQGDTNNSQTTINQMKIPMNSGSDAFLEETVRRPMQFGG